MRRALSQLQEQLRLITALTWGLYDPGGLWWHIVCPGNDTVICENGLWHTIAIDRGRQQLIVSAATVY